MSEYLTGMLCLLVGLYILCRGYINYEFPEVQSGNIEIVSELKELPKLKP